MKSYFHSSYIIFFSFLFVSCNSNSKQNNYKEITQTSTEYIDSYVGDSNCITCHETEYNLWKGSHHDLAMQEVNDSTVLGNFDNINTEIDGVTYFFFKKDKEFFVKIKEIDEPEKEYKIAYTFGVTPLQQYLIDFDKGKKQVLRVTWDVIKKKWYHQYEGDNISPHDWLHWTKGSQNWNTMCAECHSTNLKKNYFVEKDSFHTTYSSINVSCESCHGPAERHMNWANANSEDKNTYIFKGSTQIDQLNQCAPCHARRVKLTDNLEPGKHFEDQYMIQNLTTNYYHGDGQIEDEDYVYGSFLQSKMYQQGVKCGDCHNVHSMELKFKGNNLCLQCHIPANYNNEKHHFHKENTDAAQCVNCHMTGKNYMGNDFRRDHSFRIPRPDQSVIYNTPNACKECHKDKTNQWAVNTIKKWYINKKKTHFSDALLLSNSNNLSRNDRNRLDDFINNLSYPAIARATVIENLNYSDNQQFGALLIALKDSSAMIRYNVLMKFRNLPLQDRMSIALKHINDTTKLVRIGAAQLVIGVDESSLNGSDKINLNKSKGELETMLYSNADFSTGRMQLGDYYLQNQDVRTAIKHYRIALEMDSLLTPVYSNLATAYSIDEQSANALKILNSWIGVEPNDSRAYYLRALLYFELKENEKAITDLKKSISLNSNNTRAMYNLATYYYQNKKDLSLAESHIKRALKIESNNTDYKYLLSLIYQDQGKLESSQKIMQELKANQ